MTTPAQSGVLKCQNCEGIMTLVTEYVMGTRETWMCTTCFVRRFIEVGVARSAPALETEVAAAEPQVVENAPVAQPLGAVLCPLCRNPHPANGDKYGRCEPCAAWEAAASGMGYASIN